MKMKQYAAEKLHRLTALLLVLITAWSLVVPVSAADSGKTIYIGSAQEFLEFAENCRLDTWSQGKTIILEQDISLSNTDYQPISSFGGTFNGNNHAISGVTLEGSVAPAGLFSQVQTCGVIRKLHVSGYIAPSGTKEQVGGIAGVNNGLIDNCTFSGIVQGDSDVGGIAGVITETGRVDSCSVDGNISGESRAGGIAGSNLGTITKCINDSSVNTAVEDQSMSLDDLPTSMNLERVTVQSPETLNSASDTGGIAGYSSGSIYGCDNHATVGYPHIGYNVGGIVGRSCGYIYSCDNSGEVYGRKDVGGIVGQAEPYIITNFSQSALSRLQSQVETLGAQVDQAIANAEAEGDALLNRLEELTDYIESMAGALKNIQTTIHVSGSVSGSGSTSGESSGTFDPSDVDIDGEGSYESSTDVGLTPPELPAPGGIGANGMAFDGGQQELSVVPLSSGTSYEVVPLEMNIESSGTGSGTVGAETSPASGSVSGSASASGEAFASANATANTNLSGVSAALSGISGQLSVMNREATGSSETVKSDVHSINDTVNEISDTLFSALFESDEDSDIVSDTSTVNIDTVIYGKAKKCVNTGLVYGDLNVGGVAGAMSIEYEFDPENDVAANLSSRYKREYELKAILQQCENRGEVRSRKNCVGGLCGRMDLGLICDGESYGPVASENGSYVGGIAGMTSANIQSCFVKCPLSGSSCIGGVVGSGTADGTTGSGSIVAQCYTLVDISCTDQFSGAIAGCDGGTFLENYFVSDNLTGIDRLSHTGQAEPISYEQLMRTKGIPEEFGVYALTFTADDEILSSYAFSYGDSFDETVYPDIPQKDGYYACWDTEDLSDLHFDTNVSVEYIPYVTALASQNQREDGRPVFLAEGKFTDVDQFTAEAELVSTSEFTATSIDFWQAIKEYFRKLGSGHVGYIPKRVDEQWSVHIPEDSQRTHTLRYCPVDGNAEHKDVLVWENGEWTVISSDTVGSYLTFELEGSDARIAVRSTVSTWWMWLLAWVLLGLLIILLIVTIRRTRKKRRMKKAAAQSVPMPNYYTADASLMERVQAAEEMLAWAQQELEALKFGQEVQPGPAQSASTEEDPVIPEGIRFPENFDLSENTPGTDTTAETAASAAPERPPEPPQAPKKRGKWWIAVLAAVLLALAGAVLVFFLQSDAKESYDVVRLLRDLSRQEELDMELSVSVETPEQALETSARLYCTQVDGYSVSCVTQEGLSLYYAGDTVYLENGSAYCVGAMAPDYTELTEHLLDIYEATEVSREERGNRTCYRVSASAEDAELLMKLLAPEEAQKLVDAEDMEISVWTVDGAVDLVEFRGAGIISDTEETELTVSGELEILQEERKHNVPEAVRESLASGGARGEIKLTGDTLELLAACQEICQRDPFGADVRLSVNCGPLVLEDTLELYRTVENGTPISRVRKGNLNMYFAGDGVCDENGKKLALDTDTVNYAALIDAAYDLVQGADAQSSTAGDITTYEVTMEGETLEQVAYAIAPAAEELDVTLEQGTLQLVLEQGTISSLRFDCGGTIRILAVDAAAEIGCEILCREVTREAIPEKAAEALGT